MLHSLGIGLGLGMVGRRRASGSAFPSTVPIGSPGSWVNMTVGVGDCVELRVSTAGVGGPWKTRGYYPYSYAQQLDADVTAIQVSRPVDASGASSFTVGAQVVYTPVFDYYVDSVTGDDGDDGLTEGTAFATLGAVPLAAGVRIGLAKGSSWREKLVLAYPAMSVRAYGTGDDPEIDCAVVVANGDFTKTGGYTNIYECTVTVDPDTNGAELPAMWIAGVRLPKVASLAALDAAVGSIYYAAPGEATSITIYVHSTGSTNPISDGKLYEAAKWRSGIYAFSATYTRIDGIHTHRNYSTCGGIQPGRYCHLIDCQLNDGGTHNAIVRAYDIIEACTTTNQLDASGNDVPYVAYEASAPVGSWVRYMDCSVTYPGAHSSTTNAFYNHTDGVSSFAWIEYLRCAVVNAGAAFAVADCDVMYIRDCTADDCTYPTTTTNADIDCDGFVIRTPQTGGHMGNWTGANTFTFNDVDAIFDTTGYCSLLTAGATLNLTNSRIEGANIIVYSSVAGSSQTYNITGNDFVPAGRMFSIYEFGAGTPAVNSDYNNFYWSQGDFVYGGVTYADLAAWRVATGQDLNSEWGPGEDGGVPTEFLRLIPGGPVVYQAESAYVALIPGGQILTGV